MNVKNIKEKIELKKFYSTEYGRWGVSLITSAIIIVIIFLFNEPVFKTIDDARLLYVYAGYATGTPESNYLFCYYPVGWIISRLYMLFPDTSWYALFHFTLIWFSVSVIGKNFLKLGYQNKKKFVLVLFTYIFLYLTFYMISTILMHFEITATIAGTAGIILLIGIDIVKEKKKVIFFDMFLSIFFLSACHMILFNSFYAICCYLLVVMVYQLSRAFIKKNIKITCIYLGVYMLCFLFSAVIIKGIENQAKNTSEWKEYYQYNKYRVSFWDYEHISYEDDPELFDSIDWDNEFYQLTEKMYFMDERFNKENLEKIVNKFSWFHIGSLKDIFNTLKLTLQKLYEKEKLIKVHIYIIFVCFLCFLSYGISKSNWMKFYPQLLAGFSCIIGTVILILFLAMRGRLPLRAWLACMIPCGTICFFINLTLNGRKIEDTKKKYFIYLTGFCFWSILMLVAYESIYSNEWHYRRESSSIVRYIEDYAIENPEKIYIFDIYGAQNYSVFAKYESLDKAPINLITWGSSYIFTPTYYKQLNKLGKQKLLTENLFDDDVYYITSIEGKTNYKELLLEMLETNYEDVFCEKVDEIEGVCCVYKFKRDFKE